MTSTVSYPSDSWARFYFILWGHGGRSQTAYSRCYKMTADSLSEISLI